MENYRICSNCVMDTTDPEISFNEYGVCNHCREAEELGKQIWFPNEIGKQKLENVLQKIKKEGKGKKYDAVVGLSGGIDSSYLVYKAAKDWGLRLLALHVDGGWNNKIAEENVKAVCEVGNVDLEIIKIDWEEMRNLQVAFLKAAVPNQDIPQDHAFFATLYSFAVKNKIKYVLNGSNWETECILPTSWGYNAMDGRHIEDIYHKYGEGKLKNFPVMNLYYPYFKKVKIVKPLNWIPYNKNAAINELEEKTRWRYYGGKHYESIWTKFFQSYYLPKKFNFDKRKAHLSSLIVSGQITREEALKELAQPSYDIENIENEKRIIAEKLGVTSEEMDGYVNSNNKSHLDYVCTGETFLYRLLFAIYKVIRRRWA